MRRGRVLILLGMLVLIIVVVVVIVMSMNQPTGGGGEAGGGDAPEGPRDVTVSTPTPIPVSYVVISTQELRRGLRIPRDAVTVKLWPVESGVQENAYVMPPKYWEDGVVTQEEEDEYLLSDDSPVGKIVRTRIVRWQPILQSMVVRNLSEAADDVGSQTSAILPSGKVAITIPIDILAGTAFGMADGDRVDVIVSFLFVEIDEDFQSILPNRLSLITISAEGTIEVTGGQEGRFEAGSLLGSPVILSPLEDQRPRLVTQRTIQNALVVHVGEYPLDSKDFVTEPGVEDEEAPEEAVSDTAVESDPVAEGTPVPTPEPPRPSVVTLAVTPQEAVVLAWVVEAQVPITLAIRSAEDWDSAPDTTQAVSLEYMVMNYEITRPARLDYGLEPRLTGVRSVNSVLINDELITFVDVTQGRAKSNILLEGE